MSEIDPSAMPEDALYVEVMKILKKYPSVLYHHCPDSRACEGPKGLPDLLLVGPRGFMLRELKTQYADTSPGQDLWGWTFRRNYHLAANTWEIWRPSDLVSGVIEVEIQMIAQK